MLTAVTNSAAFVNFLLGVLPLPLEVGPQIQLRRLGSAVSSAAGPGGARPLKPEAEIWRKTRQ